MDGRPAPRAPRRRLPAVLSEERPRPRRVRERPGAWRLAVATVCFGAFMGLVLVPAALTAEGASELVAGLVLTALPAGFALAATCAERVLPAGLSDRARCVLGALVCLAALAVTAVLPLTPFPLVPLLALLGLGLGVYTPANNATVMAALPTRSAGTGGGLINMARGLGTALGIALVTLTLHLAGGAGPRWAVVALLPFAGLALAAALGPAWKPAGRRG